MPLHPGKSQEVISENIREMRHAGHPEDVSVAAALSEARRTKRAEGGPTERQLSPLGLYSHAAEVAQGLPQAKGTTPQMLAMMTARGVKPEEMKWAGQPAQPNVTREGMAAHFQQAMPQLQETVLGDPPENAFDLSQDMHDAYGRGDHALAERLRSQLRNPPKFEQYTLPGGSNYREVLMHLPYNAKEQRREFDKRAVGMTSGSPEYNALIKQFRQKAPFKSSHWDVPNVIAHLRLNDRKDHKGRSHLHIEELQSDWGQKGRKEGFQTTDKPKGWSVVPNENHPGLWDVIDPSGKRADTASSEHFGWEIARRNGNVSKNPVPSAPYVTSTQGWTDLGLKRALIEAARGNYSHLSWTPGEEQAKRYDLSKHISDLSYNPEGGHLQARTITGGRGISESGVHPEKLPDYIGKEAAKKLLETKKGQHFSGLLGDGWHTLTGQDLRVGGEGMKFYYDKIVPTQLMKIAKKLDPQAKLGTSQIGNDWIINKSGHTSLPYEILEPRTRLPRERFATEDEARQRIEQIGPTHVPSLEITPRMRSAILQGLPAYEHGGYAHKADGGNVTQLSDVRHTRQIPHFGPPHHPPHATKLHTGPVHSGVAGRTDHIPTHVPSGSFVIPADVVSGIGEGNSLAGFRHLKRMFAELRRRYGGLPYSGQTAPYGQNGPPYGGHASGGSTNSVPVVLAGGEHVLSPEDVRAAGGGDMEAGHRALDAFVVQYRKKLIDTLKKLPPPRND